MNTIVTATGLDAARLVGKLAAERDAADGDNRSLCGDLVRLDSVKAWRRSDPDKAIEHKADGSTIEAVYKAYRKPTEKQRKEAEGAKAAGVNLKRVVGRLIDVTTLENGDVVILMTNGLRRPEKGTPFRLLNVSKGTLYGISINGSLTKSVEELEQLYESAEQPVTTQVEEAKAPEPEQVKVPAGAVIDVPTAKAPEPEPETKKHKLK